MKIRKLLAIWAAKAAGAGCKMMGRQGDVGRKDCIKDISADSY